MSSTADFNPEASSLKIVRATPVYKSKINSNTDWQSTMWGLLVYVNYMCRYTDMFHIVMFCITCTLCFCGLSLYLPWGVSNIRVCLVIYIHNILHWKQWLVIQVVWLTINLGNVTDLFLPPREASSDHISFQSCSLPKLHLFIILG